MIGKLTLVAVVVGTGLGGGSLVRAQGTCDPPNQYCATGNIRAPIFEGVQVGAPPLDSFIVTRLDEVGLVDDGAHDIGITYVLTSGETALSTTRPMTIEDQSVAGKIQVDLTEALPQAVVKWRVYMDRILSNQRCFIAEVDRSIPTYTINVGDGDICNSPPDTPDDDEHGAWLGELVRLCDHGDPDHDGTPGGCVDLTSASGGFRMSAPLVVPSVGSDVESIAMTDSGDGLPSFVPEISGTASMVAITDCADADGCSITIEGDNDTLPVGSTMIIWRTYSGSSSVQLIYQNPPDEPGDAYVVAGPDGNPVSLGYRGAITLVKVSEDVWFMTGVTDNF